MVERINKESPYQGWGDTEDQNLDQYLIEIGETPLLAADEEVELARRARAGDSKALDKLVKANLRFVVSVAKLYQNQGLPLSDLINEGNVGLIKAASRFDESRGYKFISYAVWWVRQGILHALSEQSRSVRIPVNRVEMARKIRKVRKQLLKKLGRQPSEQEVAEEAGISVKHLDEVRVSGLKSVSLDQVVYDEPHNQVTLLELTADECAEEVESKVDEEALRQEVAWALTSLSKREADVLSLYFGINQERSYTLDEIGKHYGLTRERVRQIKQKAISRLRHYSRARRLLPYLRE